MGQEDFVDVTVKLVPKNWTLDQYKYILLENGLFTAFFNTFVLSLTCAVIQTIVCCIVAYGFAKFKFKFNNQVFMLVIFTMVVPHIVLRVSMFSYFKSFYPLFVKPVFDAFKVWVTEGDFSGGLRALYGETGGINLLDSQWPLMILSITALAYKNGLYIFMLRQFFKGVPDELEESAYIDGSGVFRTFVTIIIPLSIPMMLTVFVFAFSWQWTDNFYTKLFYTGAGPQLMPSIVKVPKSLQTNYAGKAMYDSAVKNTCSLFIIAPLLILYLIFQKSLVQGIERSGITG